MVSKKRIHPYQVLLVIFLPAFILGLFLFFQPTEPLQDPTTQPSAALHSSTVLQPTPSDEEVFSRLSILLGSNDTELVSIQYLSEENISSLSESQPVLYSNLTGPLYKLTIKQEGKLLLTLYDYSSNVVLKQFMVREVHLT